MDLAHAKSLLASASHRMTRTRELILQAVLRQRGPFSANDLMTSIELRRKGRALDLVTIYRNLPVFREAGLICPAGHEGETARFVVADESHSHHHHHIICRACHKVAAVDECVLKNFETGLRKLGFTNVDHKLEFSGICRDCK